MASTTKFLRPLKQTRAILASSSSFRSCHTQFLCVKIRPSTTRLMKWFEPVIRNRRCFGFQCNSNTRRIHFQCSYFSGSRMRIVHGILAVSAVFGSINGFPRVSYAMDELDVLGHDHQESRGSSCVEDNNTNVLWRLAKKFWLPVFFVATVLSHLDGPWTMVALKVILFLLSTNPSPYSVYIFVDEFCHRSMRQEPYLYLAKSLYAHKVEVQDFKLLCVAKVEVGNQKFTLVGILGGWWALPRINVEMFYLHRPYTPILRNFTYTAI